MCHGVTKPNRIYMIKFLFLHIICLNLKERGNNMSIKSLVLVRLPDKLDYFTGEKDLNLAGGEVCAIQEDGTFKVLPMDAETMSVQFDSLEEEGLHIGKA